MSEHWFWGLLTVACVLWYSVVTVYVAVRGAVDIKTMLAHLSQQGLSAKANEGLNSKSCPAEQEQ